MWILHFESHIAEPSRLELLHKREWRQHYTEVEGRKELVSTFQATGCGKNEIKSLLRLYPKNLSMITYQKTEAESFTSLFVLTNILLSDAPLLELYWRILYIPEV